MPPVVDEPDEEDHSYDNDHDHDFTEHRLRSPDRKRASKKEVEKTDTIDGVTQARRTK